MAAADRREQVLDAALRIIARDGYGAVSIDGIARELDVTRPVIYSQFGGLESLLLALLDRQAERALESLLGALSEPDLRNPRRYVHATVLRLCAIVAADTALWAPIFAPAAATPEVVRQRISRDREAVRRRIQTLIEVLANAGSLPAGVDPGVLSHAVVAIGQHFGRLLVEDPAALDAEAVAATLSAMLVPARRSSGRARAG
ncbi:MAG TPA: helix-turn-helix domain-containing protein [Acidimicrobiia bacterium]|nr:helix-turn-helix domain-containing protein [Acidimicrobiia bacterium]